MRITVILPHQDSGKWDQEDNISDNLLNRGGKLAWYNPSCVGVETDSQVGQGGVPMNWEGYFQIC